MLGLWYHLGLFSLILLPSAPYSLLTLLAAYPRTISPYRNHNSNGTSSNPASNRATKRRVSQAKHGRGLSRRRALPHHPRCCPPLQLARRQIPIQQHVRQPLHRRRQLRAHLSRLTNVDRVLHQTAHHHRGSAVRRARPSGPRRRRLPDPPPNSATWTS